MLAAIYTRVSDPDDPRQNSLQSQADAAIQHAEKLGYTTGPDDLYQDRFTGKYLYERPELTRLREAVRAGKYQAVVVYCLDRLGREPAHWAILFDEATKYKCQIVSATEDIDNTPEGELLRNIRGYVAKAASVSKIADRTARGTRKIIESGKPVCGGKARLGYAYDVETRKRVVADPEAEVVRRVSSPCPPKTAGPSARSRPC